MIPTEVLSLISEFLTRTESFRLLTVFRFETDLLNSDQLIAGPFVTEDALELASQLLAAPAPTIADSGVVPLIPLSPVSSSSCDQTSQPVGLLKLTCPSDFHHRFLPHCNPHHHHFGVVLAVLAPI